MSIVISEIDVLFSIITYLVKRRVMPYQYSIPRGKGIDYHNAKQQIDEIFKDKNFKPNLISIGPDIIGISQTEWWQIECKGIGKGAPSTCRNNFDRALSSVVSYYEEKPPKEFSEDKFKNAKPYLGLALPNMPAYMKELKRRVRNPLRMRLNLWILLYDSESGGINEIKPEDNYI